MYVVCKNMTYFIIKLRFAGISQAVQAGLDRQKFAVNVSKPRHAWTFLYSLSLSLSLSLSHLSPLSLSLSEVSRSQGTEKSQFRDARQFLINFA